MKRLALLALLTASFSAHAATPLSLAVGDGIALDAIYYAADEPGPALLFLNMCDPSRDSMRGRSLRPTWQKRVFMF